MGYYVRLFAESRECVPLDVLQKRPEWQGLTIELSGGTAEVWNQLEVVTSAGAPFCLIDRDARGDEIFDDEIAEFLEDLDGRGPPANLHWVRQRLERCNVIYAARYLSAAFEVPDEHVTPFQLLMTLKQSLGGIMQADGESYSNDEGYGVTLHFAETAEGTWYLAVLQPDGQWLTGTIQLDNPEQRAAFIAGQLPG